MATTSPTTFTTELVMRFGVSFSRMTEDQFWEFCQLNPEVRAERGPKGEINIMPPTGSETGMRNSSLNAQLWNWNQTCGLGQVFDSSSGFRLSNSACRSPDASWILSDRWNTVPKAQRARFAPITPDFVAELFSESDHLDDLRAKMHEYLECGVRLGWLIDPFAKRVEVYRPGQAVVELQDPDTVSADPELPGFVLDLTRVW